MAERLGFEPRKELPLCRFSRPVLSTAQPSLRLLVFMPLNESFQLKRHTLNLFILHNAQVMLKFGPTKS